MYEIMVFYEKYIIEVKFFKDEYSEMMQYIAGLRLTDSEYAVFLNEGERLEILNL